MWVFLELAVRIAVLAGLAAWEATFAAMSEMLIKCGLLVLLKSLHRNHCANFFVAAFFLQTFP
jgi:hypothetical protein